MDVIVRPAFLQPQLQRSSARVGNADKIGLDQLSIVEFSGWCVPATAHLKNTFAITVTATGRLSAV